MKYRKHQDIEISEIGVGCYALSGAYGVKDVEKFKEMLQWAFELGVTFYDTAEGYGGAEQVLGKVVKPYRDEVFIATKVGVKNGLKPNLSMNYIKKACERSLRQLQTEYIDLYQVHFDDPTTPVEETVKALEELIEEEKIRFYGVGHLPRDRIENYIQVGRPFSVLLELSAVARTARNELLPLCQQHGVGAIAFSTTGRGLLTGKYQTRPTFEPGDIRNIDPLFQRERFQSGLRIMERFREIGKEYEKTPVQIAIAWVLAQPAIISALTGSSRIEGLKENVGGSGWTLSTKDLEALDEFFEKEDKWLTQRQRSTVKHILTAPLPKDPNNAFIDLIYAMETAQALGDITEKELLPLFYELLPLRGHLNGDNVPKLKAIQARLWQVIEIKE